MNGLTLLKCICEDTRFNILELLQKNKEMSVNELVLKLKKESTTSITSSKIIKTV